MENEFKKETRYVVLKIKDIISYLSSCEMDRLHEICEHINAGREADGKPRLQSVVVENDWPEYDIVWKMIEDRMSANGIDLTKSLKPTSTEKLDKILKDKHGV